MLALCDSKVAVHRTTGGIDAERTTQIHHPAGFPIMYICFWVAFSVQKLMPLIKKGQFIGPLAYGCDAVRPALCCSISICSSKNFRKKFLFFGSRTSTVAVRLTKSSSSKCYN